MQRNAKPGGHGQGQKKAALHAPPEITAYRDEKGHLRPALFDDEAREIARAMGAVAHSQLRRFFGQVMADKRRFELRAESGTPPDDSDAQVAMALLKAKAAYAAKREKKNKPLRGFAENHARLVQTIADFRTFARHFEAVVAWHKVHEKQQGGK